MGAVVVAIVAASVAAGGGVWVIAMQVVRVLGRRPVPAGHGIPDPGTTDPDHLGPERAGVASAKVASAEVGRPKAGRVEAGRVEIGSGSVRGASRRLRAMPGPWLGALGDRALPHLPPWWRLRVAARLEASGARPPDSLPVAIGRSVVAVVTGGLVAATALGTAGRSPAGLVGVAAGVTVGVLPEAVLHRRIRERRDAMARDLPRHLDLLTISFEAGLGFDAALGRVVQAVPGPLADEFARMLGEVRAGRSRDEAMRDLARRCGVPEVRSVVLAMVQADRFGVSVGPLLRTLAEEVRTRRRLAAQAQAHKAPVKLLVPLVVCVFPALLVVVAGPALLAIRGLFAS